MRKLILLQLIAYLNLFISGDYLEELSLLAGTAGGGWTFTQQYRIALDIDNSGNSSALSDFQLK